MNERLQSLVAGILDLPTLEVTADMRRTDTAAWDSLTHLHLISAVEDEFDTTFTMDEIADLQTPAELQRVIEERGSLPQLHRNR
jgi:acyl carrier protein